MCQISVIVPVYNGASFISGLIEAFEGQYFKDFEVIFIDDGSTDGSGHILRTYADQTSFPSRILTQHHLGVSSARNHGIRKASGRYLCFVDIDDTPGENYLAYLYEGVIGCHCGLAVGQAMRTWRNFAAINSPMHAKLLTQAEALPALLYRRLDCGLWTTISERTMWEEHGLTFKEGYLYGEDLYVLWKLFALNKAVAVIEKPAIYFYNNQVHSAINQKFTAARTHTLTQLAELETFMEATAPDFAPMFKQYAVARSCWTALARAALSIRDFTGFMDFAALLDAGKTLPRLFSSPEWKVRLSSLFFALSPYAYFICVKVYVRLFARYLLPGPPGGTNGRKN